MIHFAGAGIRIGTLVRQRCSWCGEMMEEWDLALTMVPEGQDGPKPWTVGALVSVERIGSVAHKAVVAHVDGEDIPDGTCARENVYPPLRAKALRLHADGMRAVDIARRLGVSKSAVGRWLRKAGGR